VGRSCRAAGASFVLHERRSTHPEGGHPRVGSAATPECRVTLGRWSFDGRCCAAKPPQLLSCADVACIESNRRTRYSVNNVVRIINGVACFSVVIASVAIACGEGDPRVEASQYAIDPISCALDSDCCVVNDGCHSTAYVVASKDSPNVASLLASADNSRCDRCVTPMIQVSCVSGVCTGERIMFACQLPTAYPGNHCGTLEVPPSCLSSGASDAGAKLAGGGAPKPLAIFTCGG